MVREILAANPEMKAKEVVAAMTAKGHKITDNLVYFLKGKSSAKKARKKRVVKAAKAAHVTGVTGTKADALTMIREVKALALKAGGYAKLKELVDALAE
jgi:predicted ATP-grasp superfamily ATP-dependent carboligase